MVWYDNGSSKNVSIENQGIGQRRPVCRQPRISQSVNVNHFPALGSQLVWGAKAKQRQTTQHHETTHCHETGFSTTTSTLLGWYQIPHSLSYCDFDAIKFVKVWSYRNFTRWPDSGKKTISFHHHPDKPLSANMSCRVFASSFNLWPRQR
jgi:hypothetical protein